MSQFPLFPPSCLNLPLSRSWLTWGTAVTTLYCAGLLAKPVQASQYEPQLQVGVVQRFGTQPKDQLTLQATPGDRLTLRFQTDGQPKVINANSVKLEITQQPLPQPVVEEQVIFSTHRSFESAEDDAERWQAKGIQVEVAQPKRWQVWARRDLYNTPLLRRFLLQSLQSQGVKNAYLETRTLRQVPRISWVVNGFRYTRDEVDITAGKNLIQVQKKTSEEQVTRLYAGTLRIQPNAYGTYTLVNRVPVETYLRGVVPHEIGLAAPAAAIEAQAVLARTYALRNIRRFKIDNYELCADTQCQVYWGLKGAHPKTDRAIAATRGLVLTYQNELVDALYSSTTGGVTAPFNDVWNGFDRPYLRAVVDAVGNVWDLSRQSLADEKNLRQFLKQRKGFNEEGWDMFRWQVTTPIEDVTRDLQRYLRSIGSPYANFRTIKRVAIVGRSPAGRVQKVAVETDQGLIEIQKDNILNAFYAPTSLLFYIDPIYGADKTLKAYRFTGGGMGHGVGMSQTGSYRLGELGWSSRQILSFYYPGTDLKPIDRSMIFWQPRQSPAKP